jgi:hypothetical protein
LQMYDKKNQEFFKNVAPSKVAWYKHLYTLEKRGVKDYGIEYFLRKTESKYDAMLRKIMSMKPDICLTDDELRDVLHFFAFLYARNPAQISLFSDLAKDWIEFSSRVALSQDLCARTEGRSFSQNNKIANPRDVKNLSMKTMFCSAVRMHKDLVKAGRWLFYVSDSDMEFLTTDNPMSFRKLGWIPLSSKLLLILNNSDKSIKQNQVHIATAEMISDLNTSTANCATRFIFAGNIETLHQTI